MKCTSEVKWTAIWQINFVLFIQAHKHIWDNNNIKYILWYSNRWIGETLCCCSRYALRTVSSYPVIQIIWAWKSWEGNCMRSGKKRGNLMRKVLQGLLLRVFWQFLSPEAHSEWKPAITNSRYCWELTKLPRTGQFLGPYADREGVCHAIPCSVACIMVQGWCLLLTHAGRQTLFMPSMIQEGLECTVGQRKLAAAAEESPRESSKSSWAWEE